jgi:hypothetical protein
MANKNQNKTKTGQRKMPKQKAKSKALVPRPLASTVAGSEFLRCTLDPLGSKGSVGVPDKFSGQSVVVDHKLNTTCVTSGGIMGISILPTLPGALYVNKGAWTLGTWGELTAPSTYTINGSGPSFASGIPYSEYQGLLAGAPTPANPLPYYYLSNPYSAVRARIVSMSVKVVNTTADIQKAGQMFCAKVSQKAAYAGTGAVQVGPITSAGSTFKNLGYYAQSYFPFIDTNSQILTGFNSYKLMDAKDGCYMVAGRSDGEWEFKDWGRLHQYEVDSAGTTISGSAIGTFIDLVGNVDGCSNFIQAGGELASGPFSFLTYGYPTKLDVNGGSTKDALGPCFIDDSVECMFIGVEGAISGGTENTFDIQVTTCVEYQVQPLSSVAKFARQSPREDLPALAAAVEVQRKLPIALPANSTNGSWSGMVKNILSGIGTAGKFLGNIGVPFAGIAGGLASQVANAF